MTAAVPGFNPTPINLGTFNFLQMLEGREGDARTFAQHVVTRTPSGASELLLQLAAIASLALKYQLVIPDPNILKADPLRGQLQMLGVDIIDASFCEKITGRKFQPVSDLSSADLDFVHSLPESLQRQLAIIPMPGDFSAVSFGRSANEASKSASILNGQVAYVPYDCLDIGDTRSQDRWLFMLKEAAPGTEGKSRNEALGLMPKGFEVMPEAELFVALVLKSFSDRDSRYFIHASSDCQYLYVQNPNCLVGTAATGQVAALKNQFPEAFANRGLAVSRVL